MKYIKQFTIIMVISFMGECIKALLPFKIPASVYGLVIMLIALSTKIIKLDQVKETAEYLVMILPVMFVPSSVGLLSAWPLLREALVPFIVIAIVSTIVVMIVTGRVSQFIIRIAKKGEKQ